MLRPTHEVHGMRKDMKPERLNQVFEMPPDCAGTQVTDEHISLEASLEKLSIYTHVSPEQIGQLSFRPQFSQHSGFGTLSLRKETLIRRAAQDAKVVLAVTDRETIIGFSVLAHPQPDMRWAQIDSKAVMEVEMIEVIRNWRRIEVGKALLKATLCHPWTEKRIIYLVGYSWTWDLEGMKMSASQYRKMMVSFFQSFQFTERKTNEPNVCLDPQNLFMYRIGDQVDARLQEDFKWLSLTGRF